MKACPSTVLNLLTSLSSPCIFLSLYVIGPSQEPAQDEGCAAHRHRRGFWRAGLPHADERDEPHGMWVRWIFYSTLALPLLLT